MARFDFIVGKEFQQMLERDYAELLTSRDGKAWKSVQVLAGSIIEALLVDYLVSTTNPKRPKKDPLKMDLAEAIEVCKEEGALSDRTAQLCSVVRSYRNLIHPGRAVRLAEAAPTEDTATIAIALVDIILGDVARMRQRELGLTADQLLSKLERDPQSVAIARHLFEEMRDFEKERLILDVLPSRILERDAQTDEDEYDFVNARLVRAYSLLHHLAPEEVRRKAMQRYIKTLREGDGAIVTRYDKSFFSAADLRFAAEPQIRMVVEHFLARMKPAASVEAAGQFAGLEEYLTPAEGQVWLDIIVRTITSDRFSDEQKAKVEASFNEALARTQDAVDKAMESRLKMWSTRFAELKDESGSRAVARLEEAVFLADIPF